MSTAAKRYFDTRARSFDRLYAAPSAVDRLLRPGPRRGCELAARIVARHAGASVLDVGCGPGRVGETVLEAGAASYVGVDLSERMLALAGTRLERFGSVELLEADFLELDVVRTFDVVLALGLFDYVAEPERAAAWLRARCSSTLVASFTRWDWLKGPARHLGYRLRGARVFDYTEARVQTLLATAGFSQLEVAFRGRRGFLVVARAEESAR